MSLNKLLRTDNFYMTNMHEDMIRKREELSNGPIGIGVLATSKGNLGDMNLGATTSNGNILKGYQHWFSGGEITMPSCNVRALIYTERGISATIGYLANNKHYYLTNYKNSIRNFMHGDIGYYTHDGYFSGILSGGPGILRANPMASLEVYDLDTSVRINSLNYLHNHSLGSDKISYNMKKGISNETKKWNLNIDSDDFPYASYRGSLGNIITKHINEKFHYNIRTEGDSLTQTCSDYIISNDKVPPIENLYSAYDPDSTEDTKNEEYKEKFEWVEGEGRLSQEPYFLKSLNKMYYRGFKTKEASEGDSKYKLLASLFHIRDDGSIVLMSKSGSSIELNSNGNIIITPKNHLKIQSGGNLSILAGGYANIISKKTSTIRSTDESVQIISEAGTHLYSNDSNTVEAPINNIISSDTLHEIAKNKYNKIQKQYILDAPLVHMQGTYLASKFKSAQMDYTECNQLSESYNLKSNTDIMLQSGRLQWGGKIFKIAGTVSGAVIAKEPVIINHVHSSGFEYAWARIGRYRGKVKCIRIETTVNEQASLNLPIESVENKSIESVNKTLTNGYSENERFYSVPWQLEATTSWPNLTKDINKISLFPKKNPFYKVNSDGTKVEQTDWNSYKLP